MAENSIYNKLMSIQSRLKCPKNLYNSFGKYYYRNSETILESIKPLLNEEKLSIFICDSIEHISGRFYVKANVTLVDCETGEKIETCAYAREDEVKKGMDSSQITGACSSYARKYALNGMFAIDDTKDADDMPPNNTPKDNKTETKPEKTDNKKELILQINREIGHNTELRDKFMKYYNITTFAQLDEKQLEAVLSKAKKENGGK